MKKTKCGLIGCGMISTAYLEASKRFRDIEIVACCDNFAERAAAQAEKYGIKAMTMEEMLKDPEIGLVINLTPPLAHSEVDLAVLAAGKHVYSEKPFGVDWEDAKKVIAFAQEKNLRVGCAPDTFFSGKMQTARKVLDDNWIGRPLSGTAIVQGRGPEKWGHAPFFYDYGGGPMLDLGPYYVTVLVHLLGRAKSVTAVTGKGEEFRTFGATVAPQYQDKYQPFGKYPVTVPTHLAGVIEFECGALITMIASFDVRKHAHTPIELYGTEGTLLISDPNSFEGDIKVYKAGYNQFEVVPNLFGYNVNSRSIGAADMAKAIADDRPHRANGELACHVLEIMLAFERSGKEGKKVEITSPCSRPAPLSLGLADGELD